MCKKHIEIFQISVQGKRQVKMIPYPNISTYGSQASRASVALKPYSLYSP